MELDGDAVVLLEGSSDCAFCDTDEDVVETIKDVLELALEENVFAFTPVCDVKVIPNGLSSPLPFASIANCA